MRESGDDIDRFEWDKTWSQLVDGKEDREILEGVELSYIGSESRWESMNMTRMRKFSTNVMLGVLSNELVMVLKGFVEGAIRSHITENKHLTIEEI